MSKNSLPVIPLVALNAAITPHPTELTLTLIRQYARNYHTVKQLSIVDNMISLS